VVLGAHNKEASLDRVGTTFAATAGMGAIVGKAVVANREFTAETSTLAVVAPPLVVSADPRSFNSAEMTEITPGAAAKGDLLLSIPMKI